MNICMFTNTYLPHVGGVARSVSSFVADLRGLGHRVLVVAPVYGGGAKSGKTGEDGEVLRVPAIQNFNGSDFSVRLPLPYLIDQRVRRFEPDIIHSHHPFLLGDAALRTARAYRLPLVFTHHTLYEQYTHYVPFDSPTMKRFVINLVSEYANLCDAVIAPSRSVAGLLRKRGVVRPIYEVPTGVDTAYYGAGDGARFRKRHGIAEDTLVIGHLGRLAKEKNLPYLAEAVSRFMKGRGRVLFLVAGKGDAEETISRLFAEAGQERKVLKVGILMGTDLADCYAAMDVFAFASKSETQGLVLAEAMAAGTPVVALNASGVREVVRDGENGFLLRANASKASFAAALRRFAAMDDETRRAMQRAALATAEEFSRRRSVARLLDLYAAVKEKYAAAGVKKEGGRLEAVLGRLATEWDLLAEKLEAVAETIGGEKRRDRS